MGLNFILPIIAGIMMTITLGTQVVPSVVENMRIKKIENRTIANQELIKNSISRYISLFGKYPEDLNALKDEGILLEQHENNLFDGGYSFEINPVNGTLKIFTTIEDKKAQQYFENSFKSTSKPQKIEGTNEFETFYHIEYLGTGEVGSGEVGSSEVGSIEDIQDRFTESDKVGKKHKPEDLVVGAKDYIVNTETNQVTEYEYVGDAWKPNPNPINVGGIGSDTKVFVSDSRVHCENTTLPLGTEVFVVNENTGLGEIVWVAPNNRLLIKNKIFNTKLTEKTIAENILTGVVYKHNICTSNVTNMDSMLQGAKAFNQDISSWDVSKVTSMNSMFRNATSFNQDLNSWDVSNVTNMTAMFTYAASFDQPLDKWDVSSVNTMQSMFSGASIFNKDISSWDVSKVTNMYSMFNGAKAFNQDIGSWEVSNVTDIRVMFESASSFNQDLSGWCFKISLYNINSSNYNRDTPAWVKADRVPGSCP